MSKQPIFSSSLRWALCLACSVGFSIAASSADAAEPLGCSSLESVSTTAAVDFEAQIQPIFDSQCVGCHQEGGSGDLNLEVGAAWETLVGCW